MSFSEKLIKLRKQHGFSQEELGYKLNVTRQTVSKWELGQTVPEMNKLISLSQIYGISLDELTNEDNTTKKDDIKIETENKTKDKDLRKILIPLIIVLIVIALILGIYKISNFRTVNKAAGEILTTSKEIDKESSGIFISFINFIKEIVSGQIEEQKEEDKQNEIKQYNSKFDIYSGKQYGNFLDNLLENVINNNKTQKEHIITVKYNQNETNIPEEIKTIKSQLEKLDEYEVTLDYDDNGYVNKVTIEFANENEFNQMKNDAQKNIREYDKQFDELKDSVQQKIK